MYLLAAALAVPVFAVPVFADPTQLSQAKTVVGRWSDPVNGRIYDIQQGAAGPAITIISHTHPVAFDKGVWLEPGIAFDVRGTTYRLNSPDHLVMSGFGVSRSLSRSD